MEQPAYLHKMFFLLVLLLLVSTTVGAAEDEHLVGYWSLDGTSGDVTDSSQHGNNGANYGASRGIDGVFGTNAFHFDGDGYIDVDAASFFNDNIGNALTVSAWINMEDTSSNGIMGRGDAFSDEKSHYGPFYLGLHDNGYLYFSLWDTAYDDHSVLTAFSRTNEWVHLAGTYNGSHQILYIDGEEKTRNIDSFTVHNDNLRELTIGAEDSGEEYFFNGAIDEVRLYNTALTADQIHNLYTENSPTVEDTTQNDTSTNQTSDNTTETNDTTDSTNTTEDSETNTTAEDTNETTTDNSTKTDTSQNTTQEDTSSETGSEETNTTDNTTEETDEQTGEETAVPPPPDGSPISVSPEEVLVILRPGEQTTEHVTVANHETSSRAVDTSITNIKPLVSLLKTQYDLPGNRMINIPLNIHVRASSPPNVYRGKLQLHSGTWKTAIPITVLVKSTDTETTTETNQTAESKPDNTTTSSDQNQSQDEPKENDTETSTDTEQDSEQDEPDFTAPPADSSTNTTEEPEQNDSQSEKKEPKNLDLFLNLSDIRQDENGTLSVKTLVDVYNIGPRDKTDFTLTTKVLDKKGNVVSQQENSFTIDDRMRVPVWINEKLKKGTYSVVVTAADKETQTESSSSFTVPGESTILGIDSTVLIGIFSVLAITAAGAAAYLWRKEQEEEYDEILAQL